MTGPVLCVDVGSTFTKAVLVDAASGALLDTASHRTTIGTDVMEGYAAVRRALSQFGEPSEVLACSSAGGGLRLAVVGYEREVTAHAGERVGLSAGARVVHVAAGPLTPADVRALRASRPDIVLLVGGTDGGNSDILRHNASRLARARLAPPVVVAGNADAADEVAAALAATGRRFVVTGNVLPRIGVIAPTGARAAIRETFLRHVIGGKGLSRGPAFGRLVRAATPDAMLTGVQVLASVARSDVLVVDVGGATTDVYSVVDLGSAAPSVSPGDHGKPARAELMSSGSPGDHGKPAGAELMSSGSAGDNDKSARAEVAGLRAPRGDVVGQLREARTVEGDLGMRWNALGVVAAADTERLALSEGARGYAGTVAAEVGHLPTGAEETAYELELATAAAVVAVRRHARPQAPSEGPRPLHDVRLAVGSGGALRHAEPDRAKAVVEAVLTDHPGGWRTPRGATAAVDTAYVLFAVGLLAPDHPDLARGLVSSVVGAG
ncbi:Glutamate mutase, mutL [Nostocoides japonicum T1-X7]|uniref:Glutamate mutase, mutL n=1 Tax=Nostocoides japonicum T1-X7 TaxID=1194083 RepID=A0A077LW28_9MICO|nr:glutamate mutase L [Tetrasphaera japonica]CCH77921.1 Glutamate mutase, mutL [Tetrasphaera japonica T1-X7]